MDKSDANKGLDISENSCESVCSIDSTHSKGDSMNTAELFSYSNPLNEGSSNSNEAAPISRIGLNVHKAGMEGLDKEHINEIIMNASKGSKYYENEVKKEAQVTNRITQLLSRLKQLTESQKSSALVAVDKEIEALERTRVLNRVIVHIDMDAFFAAVEMRDDPSLRDVPMAVGGQSMLSTSNYIARRYGVRAAMPGFIAKKLCPNLVIVKGNYEKYKAVSKLVGEILLEYDPHYCQVGIDESYLDLTNYLQLAMQKRTPPIVTESNSECSILESYDEHNDIVGSTWDTEIPTNYWQLIQETVQEIRERIHTRTKLTASAGIAPNMLLAKIASDMNKPNGQYFLPLTRESVLEFIRKLPIRKISGIGKVSERMLNALGIQTCQDIYDQRAILYLLLSKSMFQFLLQSCLGIGSTEVDTDYERKSISTERTFSEINEPEELEQKCLELCECLAEDLAKRNLKLRMPCGDKYPIFKQEAAKKVDHYKGQQVTLKMKTIHFSIKSRSTPTSKPVSSAGELYKAASELLRMEIQSCGPQPLRLRLMGVRVSSLSKGDNDRNTLDFYAHSLSENEHHKLQFVSANAITPNDSVAVTLDSHSDEEDGVVLLTCPICNKPVCDDNDLLNSHIDVCLNQQVIGLNKTILPSTPRKHKSSSVITSTKKKTKGESSTKTKSKTLFNFWKQT